MKLKLLTDNSSLAVSLADMKLYLRIETEITDDDDLIESLIKAAETLIERKTSIAITSKTYELFYDDLKSIIEIPRPPLQSVSSIYYYDEDYSGTLVDSDSYQTQVYSGIQHGEVILKVGYAWPIPTAQVNRFKITAVCGYSDDDTDVPKDLKTAIKIIVAYWYDNRGEMEDTSIPKIAKDIYMKYKIYFPEI